MTRKISKILIFILTILAAELISEWIKHSLKIKTGLHNKELLTLVGMGIIVGVYYPAFLLIHYLSEKIMGTFIEKTGSNFLNLLLAFAVGFGILFLIYLHEWYGITIW